MSRLARALSFLLIAAVAPAAQGDPVAYPHLVIGNPSAATADPDKPDNYLLKKPHYALSYNDARGGPNWVSWCLRADDIGDTVRTNPFVPDCRTLANRKKMTLYVVAGVAGKGARARRRR